MARHRDPGLYLTAREYNVMVVSTAAALAVILAGQWTAALAALPVAIVLLYRSVRRARAATRAGLDGFTAQAPRVRDAERERKIAALRREIGDWEPGLRWLAEFDDAIRIVPDGGDIR